MISNVVDGENIGMVQSGYRKGFLLKAKQAIRVGSESFGENLQRYVAPEAAIARTINLPHPASTQGRVNRVRPEFCAGA